MPVNWTDEERSDVDLAIARHPLESGRCAALARAVFAVGVRRDERTAGRQVRPRHSAARFVLPRKPLRRHWGTHTFAETHRHAVDALTKTDGCPADEYLGAHWQYPDALAIYEVDLETIDPGIEDAP